MRLLHDLAKTYASFDDPNLVSRAGLVPVMALAQRPAWAGWWLGHVRPGSRCGELGDGRAAWLTVSASRALSPDQGRSRTYMSAWSGSLMSNATR